jgi:hypothetical protein
VYICPKSKVRLNMYLFLSFVLALASLYYLGVMADSPTADTTYLTPLMGLLIYSIITIVRELRKDPVSWLAGDYYDDECYYHRNTQSYSNRYSSNSNTYGKRNADEKVECFIQDKKVKKEDSKEIIHYPSNSEVREKIKELNKSWWFRQKKAFAGIFAIDIEEKYVKKFKQPIVRNKTNCKVKPIAKREDHTRYMPNQTWQDKEETEYNEVVKHIGRCCEIAFGDFEQKNNENNE